MLGVLNALNEIIHFSLAVGEGNITIVCPVFRGAHLSIRVNSLFRLTTEYLLVDRVKGVFGAA